MRSCATEIATNSRPTSVPATSAVALNRSWKPFGSMNPQWSSVLPRAISVAAHPPARKPSSSLSLVATGRHRAHGHAGRNLTGALRGSALHGGGLHPDRVRSIGRPLTAARAALDEERELGGALMLGVVA